MNAITQFGNDWHLSPDSLAMKKATANQPATLPKHPPHMIDFSACPEIRLVFTLRGFVSSKDSKKAANDQV